MGKMVDQELLREVGHEQQVQQPQISGATISTPTLGGPQALLSSIAVPVVVIIALALRLYRINVHSLWYDELASIETAQRGISAIFSDRFGWIANQTQGHYLLMWLMNQFADPASNPLFVRLPSLLAGTLTCLVAYGIGRQTFGWVQGILTCALVALSPTFLQYSQDARPYALLVFLTTLSIYCLLRAQLTGYTSFWIAFTLATVANLCNSYMALTLVLPALAPYLLWLLWRTWKMRRTGQSRFRNIFLSLAAISLASIPVLLGLSRLPRAPLNLAGISPVAPLTAMVELTSWTARLGLDSGLERFVQLFFVVLAIAGFYGGFRMGGIRRSITLLCGLLLLVPSTIMVVLSTSSAVFQRYVLFCLPFYFLLIANGVVWPLLLLAGSRVRLTPNTIVLSCALLVVVFGIGAANYSSTPGHSTFAPGPDYQSVAAYLSSHTNQSDLVIFADAPAHGIIVSDFYWKGKRPLVVYDARDPLLDSVTTKGDLYLVSNALQGGQNFAETKLSTGKSLTQVASFENVEILRESRPASVVDSLEALLMRLEQTQPDSQPIMTLRASAYQDEGQLDKAAEAYRVAGTYFPLGAEHLRTAIGLVSLGETRRAWQEGLLSKFVQPQRPEVHAWLSAQLKAQGFENESRVESMIAADLTQGIDSQTVGERK